MCVLEKKIHFIQEKEMSFSPSFNFLKPLAPLRCVHMCVSEFLTQYKRQEHRSEKCSCRLNEHQNLKKNMDAFYLYRIVFIITHHAKFPHTPIFFSPERNIDYTKKGYSKQSSFDNLYDSAPEKQTGWFGTLCTRNLHFSLG